MAQRSLAVVGNTNKRGTRVNRHYRDYALSAVLAAEFLVVLEYLLRRAVVVKPLGKRAQRSLAVVGNTNKRGTRVTFYPDAEIFETLEFNYVTLRDRLRELAARS